MRYSELKNRFTKEVNAFPMRFAFDDKQFKKGLEDLGITEQDAVSVGAGGFIRKKDKDALSTMFNGHNAQIREALKNDGFMIDAIKYELANHEFIITYDPYDALSVLDLSLDNERVKRCFNEAKKQYLEEVD